MSNASSVTDGEKLSGLFRFAQGVLEAKGTTPLRMQSDKHGFFPEWKITGLPGLTLQPDNENWLKLERLRETAPPKPSENLIQWIEGRFDLPDRQPEFRSSIVVDVDIDKASELCEAELLDLDDIYSFGDDSESGEFQKKVVLHLDRLEQVGQELEEWRAHVWSKWAKAEKPVRQSIGLYNQLFKIQNALHGGDSSKPMELVWGIGLARWKVNGDEIDLPLIEQLVDLEVLLGGGLCIRPRSIDPLFTLKPFLELQIEGAAAAQRDLQERFSLLLKEDTEVTPFDVVVWENLLDAAATRLSSRAQHITRENIRDGSEVKAATGELKIYSSWAVYGRRRSESLRQQDLENIRSKIEQIKSDDDLPESLRGLVAVQQDSESTEDDWELSSDLGGLSIEHSQDQGEWTMNGSSENTSPTLQSKSSYFFPLPYNREQSEIIDRLETEAVVTVTGPPGTGKTHTIANIISHYMAMGRRVLVTARTAEAIAAVREKLPEELSNLVVASVASDREGNKQFEEAIQRLLDDVLSLDVNQAKESIAQIEQGIIELDENIIQCEQRLSAIALENLSPLSWKGKKDWTAMDLSQQLQKESNEYDWMMDRPSQLPSSQLVDVVERLRVILPQVGEDIVYMGKPLPGIDALPNTEDLIRAHHSELQHRNRPVEDFTGQPVMAKDVVEANQVALQVKEILDGVNQSIQGMVSWERVLLKEAIKVAQGAESAKEVFLQVEQTCALLDGYAPGEITYQQKEVDRSRFVTAVARAKSGKSPVTMGAALFNRSLVAAIESIRLDGERPETVEAWSKVYDTLKVEDLDVEIRQYWNSGLDASCLPELPRGTAAVRIVGQTSNFARQAKELASQLLSQIQQLKALFPYGIDIEQSIANLQLEKILKAIRANLDDDYQVPSVIKRLEVITSNGDTPIFQFIAELKDSLGQNDISEPQIIEARGALTSELQRLSGLQALLLEVEQDLKALQDAGAVEWADKCVSDPYEVDRTLQKNWQVAWEWAVMQGKVDSIIALGNGDQWRKERDVLRRSRELKFEELIRLRTLAGLKKRMTGPIQSALSSFTTAINKLGKGTGKSASRLRRAARKYARIAAPAAPVWVMPEYKIAEQLGAELGDFDLVILDEASQSDVTAVAALARGKKHLIVGDEQQVSPVSVGTKIGKIDVLRSQYLAFLPNKSVIDEKSSIFEIAMQMFPRSNLILREHFRCVEPIIQFSTQFYSGRLIPLRIPKASERFDPPLVDVFIEHGKRQGKINESEAQFIVDEIAVLVNDSIHSKRDIAVISLIGTEQAERIERMLMEDKRIGTDKMSQHSIICGDSRTMQGQERSIVFLSMVAAPDTARAQTTREDHQRFNVALSRARDRLYLVHSVAMDSLKPEDMKFKALKHFSEPMPEGRSVIGQDVLERCDSKFEKVVCRKLLDANYRVYSQVKAGPYRIDLVVEGADDRRLAIELDGDHWHGPDQWEKDMERQAILERAGWTFWRVFGSQWNTAPDYWWNNLVERLSSMEIAPIGAEAAEEIFTDFRVINDVPDFEEETRSVEFSVEAEELELNPTIPADLEQEGNVDTESGISSEKEFPMIDRDEGAVDNSRFHDDSYRSTIRTMGCAIIDQYGPITNKDLCEWIARKHRFNRTGGKIKQTIWKAVSGARQHSKDLVGMEIFWPQGQEVSEVISFRGMTVGGVVRSWSDLPYPEKLGLMESIFTKSDSKLVDDVIHQVGQEVGLKKVRSGTRTEMVELWRVVQQKELDLLTVLND